MKYQGEGLGIRFIPETFYDAFLLGQLSKNVSNSTKTEITKDDSDIEINYVFVKGIDILSALLQTRRG